MNSIVLSYSDHKINLLYKKNGESYSAAQSELPSGVVEDSVIIKVAEFARILNSTIKNKFNLRSQITLRLTIPEDKSYIQILRIPGVPKDKISQVIRWQSKSLLTFDIETVYLDSQVIEEKNSQLKILVTAVPKKVIDSLIAVAKINSYQIGAIDTRSGALARIFAVHPHELVAIADIEDKVATLVLAKNSVARLASVVELSDKDRPFVKKIKELIEFYTTRKETDKELSRLYIIGDIPQKELDQWEKSLGWRLELVSFGKVSGTKSQEIPDVFIANLGLFGDLRHGVNLLPASEAQEMEKSNLILQIKRCLWVVLGLLLLLIIVNGVIYYNAVTTIYQLKDNTLSAKNNLSQPIISDLNAITSEVNSLPEIKGKTVFLSAILNQPIDGVSVSEIIIDKDLGTIKGSAKNRPALVNFITALKANKIFNNVVVPLSNYENNDNIPLEITFKIL